MQLECITSYMIMLGHTFCYFFMRFLVFTAVKRIKMEQIIFLNAIVRFLLSKRHHSIPFYPLETHTHTFQRIFYSSSRIFVPPQRLTSQLRYLQKVVVFFWPTLTVKVDNVGRLYIINHSPHNRQTDRHTKTDMPHKINNNNEKKN